jgi:hypothetical protein
MERLVIRGKNGYFATMSTVLEIEAAIEKLPAAEFGRLLAWIEEYQATVNASAAVFSMLDAEENGSGEQWRETK